MKKEAAIKRLTTLHNTLFDTIQKIRDFVYTVDDFDLSEDIDTWFENFEEFLEGDGSLEGIIESLEDVFHED